MTNLITKTTDLAMTITLQYVKRGDTVVDATCGTGQDTVSLAKAVGDEGTVYAFDIQQDAIDQTEQRLKDCGLDNAKLIKDSFVRMAEYVSDESVSAMVFNLGYLPGGDHSITTMTEDTLKGLEASTGLIKAGGIITVVLYDGHHEGQHEKEAVLKWAETLDASKYHVAYVSMTNQKNNPPEILWITKKTLDVL